MTSEDLNATITRPPTTTPHRIATRIALAYIFVGTIWIVLSDKLLALVWPDDWLTLSWIKGVAFILCTGGALYILVREDIQRMLTAELQQREALNLCAEVIKHCPSAILLFDARRVRLVNPAFVKLLRFDSDARARQSSLDDYVHPDDLSEHQAQVQALLKTPDASPSPIERRLLTCTSELLYVDIVLTSIGAGSEQLILAVMNDTTQRRAQAAHLIESERLAAVGRLAAGTAHGLNNLLAAISNCNNLLQRYVLRADAPVNDPDISRCLNDIEDITRRGHAIAEELMAFSATPRIASSIPSLLNDSIRDATRFLQHLLPSGIQLSLDLSAVPLATLLSPSNIDQILLNLITNSRDALRSGGVIRITTSLIAGPPPSILFCVSDNGVGIPLDVQARLFSPFFSTKQPGRGTGIGLVTVQRLITQAGGALHIHSAPSEGTRVEISLPPSPLPAPSPARRPTPPSLDSASPISILLVDDEPMVRSPLARLLQCMGYLVVEASGGAEALLRAQSTPFDVILSDLNMPDMDGLALLQALRDAQLSAPLILMSGGPPLDTPSTTSSWLQKPFGPDALRRAIYAVTSPPHLAASPAPSLAPTSPLQGIDARPQQD
jgi:two-component system, cell cycle sensor histidine kinase and response regulator CckA